jgi:hypothetical protein
VGQIDSVRPNPEIEIEQSDIGLDLDLHREGFPCRGRTAGNHNLAVFERVHHARQGKGIVVDH